MLWFHHKTEQLAWYALTAQNIGTKTKMDSFAAHLPLPKKKGHKVLGILGGMGPLAGAAFAYRLVQLTPAHCDQEHIPVLLRNDPRIPDRSTAHMGGGGNPLPAMLEGVRFLTQSGVNCIAIPCNTAHLWFDPLQQATSIPVLHIAEAVIKDLQRQGIHDGKVGIMGTTATLNSGLYQRHLESSGYTPIIPTPEEVQNFCRTAITAVKANRLKEAFLPASQGIKALEQRGAQAVVLGCTELPLAIPPQCRQGLSSVLTDSIDALAYAVLEHFGYLTLADAAVP